MEQKHKEILESIYQGYLKNGDNVVSVLQEIQNNLGCVEKESVAWFARRTRIPAAKFYGVLTFYSQFHIHPRGENIVTVCSGTVCHVKGADKITAALKENLKLRGDAQTTKDKLFTLEKVNCVGACSIAPVVTVNTTVYGKQSSEKMLKNLQKYKGERSES